MQPLAQVLADGARGEGAPDERGVPGEDALAAARYQGPRLAGFAAAMHEFQADPAPRELEELNR